MKKPTKEALAEMLGVSRKTLYSWAKQGCPIHKGLDAIQRWRQANAPEKQVTQKPAQKPVADGEDLKARLMRAQAEHYETKTKLAELEHQVKTGQLVNLEQVEALLREWYAPVSEHLRTLPDRLAHQVNPTDPKHARGVLDVERDRVFVLAQNIIKEGGA